MFLTRNREGFGGDELSRTRALLKIRGLKVNYYTYEGIVRAVDIERLEIFRGEVLGLVGESGCGKSTTALAILRLLPSSGRVESGEIIFDGVDLLKLDEAAMQKIRGKRISMIFQNPRSSLNPVFTIGEQITRVIRTHQDINEEDAREKAIQMLGLVGLPDPERILKRYPHELSTGMCQRVMISMALSCNPDLLIADEPTSALDVTIQAQILNLLNELREKIGSSILYITHDLAVTAQLSDRVAVMYAGNIVEISEVGSLYEKPMHPYTQGLLRSIPTLESKGKLETIKGRVPKLINPPPGCKFHNRCPFCMDICKRKAPMLVEVDSGHFVACFLYGGCES